MLNVDSYEIYRLLIPFSRIGFSIIVGALIIAISKTTLRLIFNNLSSKSRLVSYKKRLDTLRSLIDNAVFLIVFAIVFLMVLKDFGFDITPILASAGLLGLAISFGAQSLVRDLIAGFFLILENQFNVGDTIEVGDTKGEVVHINLRTTVIKDKKENRTYLPNSKIEKVTVFKNVPKKDE